MQKRIKEVIDREIAPMLAMHGGGVELVDITEDGIVKLKLVGGCSGCPSAQLTLSNLIESVLKEKIPEIKKVEAV